MTKVKNQTLAYIGASIILVAAFILLAGLTGYMMRYPPEEPRMTLRAALAMMTMLVAFFGGAAALVCRQVGKMPRVSRCIVAAILILASGMAFWIFQTTAEDGGLFFAGWLLVMTIVSAIDGAVISIFWTP